MALAGHSATVWVKSSSTAPSGTDEVAGIKNFSAKSSKTMLDITDFADTSGCKLKLAGLEDGSFNFGGDYIVIGSSAAQGLIRSSFYSGATIYVTVLYDGTNGYTWPCIVADYEVKAGVDGTVEFSANFMLNGAKTARGSP